MPATKTQLVGGSFQDAEGAPLSGGYLLMKLSQDEGVSGVGLVAAGIEIRIQLDSYGSVIPTPIWANDIMIPVNSYYRVTGYTMQGQPSFGPNNQQVLSGGVGGGTFDTGTWIPNTIISWVPPLQPVLLETNGVTNSTQILQNLVQGTNITLTETAGAVIISSTGGANFSTPGQGFFWSGKDIGIFEGASAGLTTMTNQVTVHQLIVPCTTTVRGITVRTNGGVGGTHYFTCALYSFDGNTKLIDAGTNAFQLVASTTYTQAVTPTTLQFGVYWFGYSADIAAGSVTPDFAVDANAELVLNNSEVRLGTAANLMVAGAMPATLGTITALPGTGFTVPAFLFEV